MSTSPLIAITIGDPAGIGPEVAVKGALAVSEQTPSRIVLVGARAVLDGAARWVREGDVQLETVADVRDVVERRGGPLQVFDTGSIETAAWETGVMSRAGGVAAAQDTETAVRLALDNQVDAIVSGPINKHGLALAGRTFPGQTEFIRHLTGAEPPLKILVGGKLRVAQLTSHMPLSEAIRQVTSDRVRDTAIRLSEALRGWWGIENPRIGVSALNPHAGEDGLLGREELDEINPGVQAARELGYDVNGAIPSDVVFLQGETGRWDGVVSLFHDQGTLPLKRLKFASVAHGLPIVRTTPGHGTAYDIAGTGAADETAMTNAITVATTLAVQRLAARHGRS